MAIFTAVRNKKQTAGTMMGVLKYVTQACKTMRSGSMSTPSPVSGISH